MTSLGRLSYLAARLGALMLVVALAIFCVSLITLTTHRTEMSGELPPGVVNWSMMSVSPNTVLHVEADCGEGVRVYVLLGPRELYQLIGQLAPLNSSTLRELASREDVEILLNKTGSVKADLTFEEEGALLAAVSNEGSVLSSASMKLVLKVKLAPPGRARRVSIALSTLGAVLLVPYLALRLTGTSVLSPRAGRRPRT